MGRRFTTRYAMLGYTLIEMTLSLTLLGIIMASVGSAVMFASQAIPDDDSPVATLIQDSTALSRLAEDLALAKYVTERGTNAVTIVVDDRTGDGLPDRIRYAWSGTPGDPLTVELNGGPPTNVIDNLYQLQLDYSLVPRTVLIPAPPASVEVLIASSEDTTQNEDVTVKPDNNTGQLTTPTLRNGVTGFTPTRVEFYVEPTGNDNGVVLVELRDSDLGDPGPTLYGSGQLLEEDLESGFNWFNIDLADTALVAAGQAITLVASYESGSNSGLWFKFNTTAGGTLLTSTNGGSSWIQTATASLCYRLYGVLEVPLADTFSDQALTREHIEAMDITLQSTAQGRSPMRRTVRLEQAPEVLTQFWEADFNVSPTGQDLNDDGTEDWAYGGGGAIPNSRLLDGVWSSQDALAIQPADSLDAVVRIDARMRAQSGDVAKICGSFHSDGNGNVLPFIVVLQEDTADGQELVFFNEQTPTAPIATITGISRDWVDIQLTFLPDEQFFSVRVNGMEEGTAGLAWEASQGRQGFWIEGSGSGADFSSIRYTFGGSYVESATAVPENALGGTASAGNSHASSDEWRDFWNNLFGG